MSIRSRNIFIYVLLIAVLMMQIVIPFSAYASEAEETHRVVRVAYFISYNFQEMDANGEKKSGYAYEMLQKVSDLNGWTYEYVYGTWPELYAQFLAGDIDIFCGLAYSNERSSQMMFTSRPMDTERYYIFARADDPSIRGDDPESFKGKKIGAITGSIMQGKMVSWARSNGIEAEQVLYSTLEELTAALENGEVDAIAIMYSGIDNVRNIRAVTQIGENSIYICVRNGAVDILSDLNRAMNYIFSETPGYQEYLRNKYYTNTVSGAGLTAEQSQWIDAHPVLRVGYIEEYMPFCGVGEGECPDGLLPDIMDMLIDRLEIGDRIRVEYKAYPDYASMTEAIGNDEIDIAFPVIDSIWHSEQRQLMETNTVISTAISLIYAGDYNAENITTVAISQHSPMQQIFVDEYCENLVVVEVESAEECLRAVNDGRVSCTIFTSSRARNKVRDEKYPNLRQVQMPNSVSYCFGIRKGNVALMSLMNRGIERLDHAALNDKMFEYSEIPTDYSLRGFIQRNVVVVLALAGVILLLIITIFLIYSRGNEKQKKQLQLTINERDARIAQEKEMTRRQGLMIAALKNVYKTCMAINLTRNTYYVFISDQPTDCKLYTAENAAQMLEDGVRVVPEGPERDQFGEKFLLDKQLEAYKRGERRIELEHRIMGTDGRLHWCRTTAIFLEETDGCIRQVSFNEYIDHEVEQTSALRDALEAAQHASRSKSTFLSAMSHDIRTPMNAIIGFANLALKHTDDPNWMQDHLNKILISSKQLLSLINDVLDMSRIESGKVQIEEKPEVLPDILRGLLTIVQANADERQQNLFVDAAELSIEPVMCDALRFTQVLLNILSNAVKYTPKGGRIELWIRRRGDDLPDHDAYDFVVRDSGIGMSAEFLQHIFEPFEREETATVSGITGSGLGMAITKTIVDLMGGKITVESAEGKGTEFTVSLSFKRCDRQAVSDDAEAHTGTLPELAGRRVLLVEDNALNREIATEILESAGIDVDIATDGVVAVEKMKNADAATYDLILMDIQMPRMDGCEATRRIRQLPNRDVADIPIIAMTANAFEEDREIAFEVGMNDHLAKPIDVEKLLNTIARYLH